MSKGSIVDFKVRVKPSQKLIDFITSLNDIQLMPENVIKLFKAHTSNNLYKNLEKGIFQDTIKSDNLTQNQMEILKSVELQEVDYADLKNIFNLKKNENETENKSTQPEKNKLNNKIKKKLKLNKTSYLELTDLKWLNKVLEEKRNKAESELYLHELLQGSELILPENEMIPRNPELEARCKKLREEQAARDYRKMTKNVDTSRKHIPDDTISYQIKVMNRQLIAVLQFIFSVAAGFAFGFLGVELIIGNLDFGFRLLLGIICSLTIALAEIYFLAKKLNEYDEVEAEPFPPTAKKVHLD